jgi:tRNA1Val (adenine37-N6)-methyltransferase
MTQRPGRLPDLLCGLRSRGLEPRSLREVLPMAGRPASLLLATAVKGAKPGGFTLLPPLTVRNPDGSYTDEVQALYKQESMAAPHLLDGLVRVAGQQATDDHPGGKP